ncbi:uncharacterized protein LOC135620147 isoform X1 [Musa acuminata AAA Group]|uniref:uncharacterized protein LOC135620147 isoform X1 n=1 Tax=Musa acuminata AAA Group TaxID=214697 RepID=UPI0031D090E9
MGTTRRYAMVCSSNQNRSMEAHALLKRQGFDVSSYGTGAHVKLPGPSLREPNVYDFGTPYKFMHDELRRKDPDLYKRNGILPMLKRNLGVKNAPQRWQDNAADGCFDVVMTFEEKVFDTVIEDLNNREQKVIRSVLIINLEVKDNHEEAATGAKLALDLCQDMEICNIIKLIRDIWWCRLNLQTAGRMQSMTLLLHLRDNRSENYSTPSHSIRCVVGLLNLLKVY